MADVDNIEDLKFMEDDYLGFDDEPLEELCPFPIDEGIDDSAKNIVHNINKMWASLHSKVKCQNK
jgi:hypothetical protein